MKEAIARTASATSRPCAISTLICRSFATISSAVCLFLAIDPILHLTLTLQRQLPMHIQCIAKDYGNTKFERGF
jgi:hypothetical protein